MRYKFKLYNLRVASEHCTYIYIVKYNPDHDVN